tara:strand:+ start:20048 stop:20506 length:459 start_codon:yes stop_codon:yes gene_type:complete
MKKINKECGDCTLCCELLPIGEINKPASVLCGDCVLTKGCSIYDKRPQSCRDFECSYISSDDMEEDLKPINCNVIFEKVTETVHLALIHPKDLDAWQAEPVKNYILGLKANGISTIISSYTRAPKYTVVAEGRTKEDIWEEAMGVLNKELKE